MECEAIFLGGRSGVGKSTVAFEMHARLSAAGVSHCVIDGDYLDMAHPPPWEHELAERNLAAMWDKDRALGYRRLIYVNSVCVLPEVTDKLVTVMGDHPAVCGVLLTCTDDTARRRLGQREIGSTLNRHLHDSAATADLLATTVPDRVHAIRTDDLSVADIAERIINSAGWLPAIESTPAQPESEPIDIRPLRGGDVEELFAGFDYLGWDKPRALFERYLYEQHQGLRQVCVAAIDGRLAGYLTVVWLSDYPPFRDAHIPEIVDLNVYPHFRRRGVARTLIDAAEVLARDRSDIIGIGYGLGSEYGAAQRLYAGSGYLPDGRGVMYDREPVEYGASLKVDDSATLMLTKRLI